MTSRPSRRKSPRPSNASGKRRQELWRVAHPFDPDVAVRITCWFPSDEEVAIALVGFGKKATEDVFYASAAARGEAMAGTWLRRKGSPGERGGS
jgi:hypothetical protein